jgi:hypothetical protein
MRVSAFFSASGTCGNTRKAAENAGESGRRPENYEQPPIKEVRGAFGKLS